MSTFSEIQLSEIELGRMDAEYYRPQFTRLSKSISERPNTSIRRAGGKIDCSAFYPSIVPYYNFNQQGTPFLRVNEIQDGLLSIDNNTAFLPKEILEHNHSTIATCQPGDLIIAKGGNSLGKVALLTEQYPEYSVCRDVLVVRTQDISKINRFYLWMYLHSDIGQSLLIRTASQTGQPHLTIDSVASLKIPLISEVEQQKIHSNYMFAEAAMRTSREASTKARQLIDFELGLENLEFSKPVGYTATFSQIGRSLRFDSERYYPAFESLIKRLPNHIHMTSLGSVLESCRRGKQPLYSEYGLPVLNSKHILQNKIILEGNRFARPNADRDLQIRFGDVLINGTGRGTIGRSAPYLVADQSSIPDNHVTILRSSELDPAYLSFYLNSLAGRLQVEMHQRGSSGQLELYPFDIRKFQVWIAPKDIQNEIRRLSDLATDSAKQSQQLLDETKARVERLIEEAVAA